MRKRNVQPVVLIVDDEPEIRDILVAELGFKGYKTIQKSGGFEAIAFLRKHKVDAVLTDLRMNGGSGIDLLQFISQENNPPAVIVISALADSSGPELRALGANAVFPKPFDLEALCETLYKAIYPPLGKEGRRQKRFPVALHAEIQTSSDGAPRAGKVLNISHGGLFLAMSHFSPSIGDTIYFSIEVTFGQRFRLEGCGIIRWIQRQKDETLPSGFGVEFLPLNSDSSNLLDRLLSSQRESAVEESEGEFQEFPRFFPK